MIDFFKAKDEIKNMREADQKKGLVFISNQNKINGLNLWEYNAITNEIKQAIYEKIDVFVRDFSGKSPLGLIQTINHRVIAHENCIYVQAINKETALKKIARK